MGGIHITVVGDAHGYTRSSMPWRLDAKRESEETAEPGRRPGWKLFHYLSGGGMRAFGRTVEQEEADSRRAGFLAASAAVGAAWLFFWLF